MSIITLGRRKAAVAPEQKTSGKKALHQSNKSAIWLVSLVILVASVYDESLYDAGRRSFACSFIWFFLTYVCCEVSSCV